MSQTKKIKQSDEPVHTEQPAPTLNTIATAYKIEKAYPYFYMSVYTLYDNGTWVETGKTDKETISMVLDRLEKLSLKGLGKL